MKFAIRLDVSVEAGNAIESQPGGPGPIVGRFVERFKPEAVYFATSERTIFAVVDFPDGASIVEFMVFGARLAGTYPEMTPVLGLDEFGPAVETALAGADKLVNG